MRKLLRIDIERMIKSPGMWVSLFISLALVIAQFITVVLPESKDVLQFYTGDAMTYPDSVYNIWFGADAQHPFRITYLTIFPLLSTLPYGITYHKDRKKGYINQMYTRMGRGKYLVSRYIATFVSGGLAVLIPMVIAFILAADVLPLLKPVNNRLFIMSGSSLLGNIYYTKPLMYMAVYAFIYFIYGGVFASIALAVGDIFDYSFFVLIMPFAVYYVLGYISQYIYFRTTGSFDPRIILGIIQSRRITAGGIFIETVVIGLISFLIYWHRGMKKDVI